MAALRRKKQSETELVRLSTHLQLEAQINLNTLESADLNAETMTAIRKASKALSDIHSGLCVARASARRSLVAPSTYTHAGLTLVPLLARYPKSRPSWTN